MCLNPGRECSLATAAPTLRERGELTNLSQQSTVKTTTVRVWPELWHCIEIMDCNILACRHRDREGRRQTRVLVCVLICVLDSNAKKIVTSLDSSLFSWCFIDYWPSNAVGGGIVTYFLPRSDECSFRGMWAQMRGRRGTSPCVIWINFQVGRAETIMTLSVCP